MDLPQLTQEPIKYVDSTPDENYPIRILQAYLADCNCKWVVSGVDEKTRIIYDLMNEACDKRSEILRKAIDKLGK